MASTYKAPGVFVEEITKFPPSVAAVETAIPAFIGYTEKAEKNGESLKNVPTSVTSFLQFEQYFGGPPPRNVIVRLNSANQYVKTERQGTTYLLYDSLRLFYDNGGGECYIVSVDNYSVPPELGNMGSSPKGILGGLRALEKYDKPTLIASPDATSIGAGLYSFQQQALMQCNKLQDRFLICDLLKNNELVANETLDDRVTDFRGSIGINFLKYGAAYVPWLKTALPVDLHFRDVIFAFESQVGPTDATSLALLLSLTTNPEIKQLLFDLNNSRKTVDALKTAMLPGGPLVAAGMKDIRDQVKTLQTEFQQLFNGPSATISLLEPKITPIYTKNREILTELRTVYLALPAVVTNLPTPSAALTIEFKLRKDIDNLKAQGQVYFNALATHHKEIEDKPGNEVLLTLGPPLDQVMNFLGYLSNNLNTAVPVDSSVHDQYRVIAARAALFSRMSTIAGDLTLLTATAVKTAIVAASSPTLADLKTKIQNSITAAKVGPPADLNAMKVLMAAIVPADEAEKTAIAIATAYLDEEIATLGGTASPNLFPNTLPEVVYNTIFQDIVNINQAVAAAEATGILPATRAAGTVTYVFEREYALLAANGALDIAAKLIALYESIQLTAQTYETTFEQSLLQSFGVYKTLLAKAAQELMILPPSAGVAGVYASVDNNRGVWKAPANASLNSVLAPLTIINSEDQEELNIDPNAGKSINAIRQFIGKGTLVWGTRTLAGNDNEWKFVPVRRFFTYAEESIKKATEPFVFEPNDRNTWVRVRAMIENFLTLEWRRGALAGAKPSDAFYVKVGLGETMTAVDILDGKMIIEVGMAVVRPAEFIILRFAHKMQES
jgi:phage tail sheath protein FI